MTPVGIRMLRVRGRLDRAFAQDGRATTDFDGTVNAAQAVAVGTAGTIIVAGWSSSTSEYEPDAFALSRYLPDGSLDPSFGHGGRVTTDFGADGKIVIGGSDGGCYEEHSPLRVARLNPDGSSDASLGRRGRVRVDFARAQSGAQDVTVDSRDRILVAGAANGRFALARLTAGGSLDVRFGNRGKVLSPIASRRALPASIVSTARGGFVVGGTDFSPSGNADHGVIGLYNARGTLTRSLSLTYPGAKNEINALAVDSEGRLLAAGAAREDFAIARLR